MNLVSYAIAMGMRVGQSLIVALSYEEIVEATDNFRNDGWKTIFSFLNNDNTEVTYASVKEGESFGIEHSISKTDEDTYIVKLRLVSLNEIEQYIDDWLPHCKKLD